MLLPQVSGLGTVPYRINNEALCSSCALKLRNFQTQQEDIMASMRKRGLLSASFVSGFLRPQGEEVDTVPRFMHDNRAF